MDNSINDRSLTNGCQPKAVCRIGQGVFDLCQRRSVFEKEVIKRLGLGLKLLKG
jgi:hypothetical protein